jgi:hypothetical protein
MFYEVTPMNKDGERLITGHGGVPPSPESDSISLDLLAMERMLSARPSKSPHHQGTVNNDDSLSNDSDKSDSCDELLARATKLSTGSKKSQRRPAPLDSQLDQAQEPNETQVCENVSASMKQNSEPSLTAPKMPPSESLLDLFKTTQKQLKKAATGNLFAKQHRIKKQPQRVSKGFGYIGRMETRRKCQTCSAYIKSGSSAIQYHETARGKGAGKTSYYHESISCLSSINTKRKEEFIEKKWSERHVGRL